MKIFFSILELFSEKKCFSCSQVGHFFCQKCFDRLDIYEPYCYLCKKPSSNFALHTDCYRHFPLEQVIVLTHYRNPWVKRLLRHAKYYGKHQAYSDIIYKWQELFEKNISDKNALLVPVPIPLFRRWKRGYNQTDIIAKYLSKILDIPVDNNLLKRKMYSKQQSHLSQSERKKNIKNTFFVQNNSLRKDITLYLVDDIISTGATLLEIAHTLRQDGFTDIRAMVLASD